MLENSLMQLMEDIRCYWSMDIGDRKTLPKKIVCCCCKTILQTILVSRGYRLCFPKIVGILDDAESMFWISGISQLFVLQIICWLLTFGACTIFGTWNQTLFWIISNISCQDRMDSPLVSISTIHIHTFFSCLNERLEDKTHWVMEESQNSIFFFLLGYAFTMDFGGWEICNKNSSMFWWFLAYSFWYVSKSKVDRICRFVTRKLGKLSFICCNYYWSNSASCRKLALNTQLTNELNWNI